MILFYIIMEAVKAPETSCVLRIPRIVGSVNVILY
jgi:hypothetical protein